MKIVLATSNQGKVKEFKELLKEFDINIIPQSALGVEDAAETGLSFVENAILKARHAAQHTGLPALADDSGLMVNALQGAPGIYSARFAGLHANAENNIKKLLTELKHTPDNQRQASFYCALVFVSHALDPAPLICQGQWFGEILHAPQGENGFGYDPVFYVPSQGKTAAELNSAIKNTISHRGTALQLLLKMLPEKI
jgi:XTP/dITP diphosphohydrolase